MFYCMFYFNCDRSFTMLTESSRLTLREGPSMSGNATLCYESGEHEMTELVFHYFLMHSTPHNGLEFKIIAPTPFRRRRHFNVGLSYIFATARP